MSLRQKLRLELEDGTEIVTEYSAVDLRAWEKAHKKSSLGESMSVGMLTWLGWSSARRSGKLNGAYTDYAKFDEVCVDVGGVEADEDEESDEETPTGPADGAGTRKARGRASSAPSP